LLTQRGSISRRKPRADRNWLRVSRCSAQASQCLRRSGGWILGLFQPRSYVAGCWQPRAEQSSGSGNCLIPAIPIVAASGGPRGLLGPCGQFRPVGGPPEVRLLPDRPLIGLVGQDHRDVGQHQRAGEQHPARHAVNEDHREKACGPERHGVGVPADPRAHLNTGRCAGVGDERGRALSARAGLAPAVTPARGLLVRRGGFKGGRPPLPVIAHRVSVRLLCEAEEGSVA
jgi:hypothetical protein